MANLIELTNALTALPVAIADASTAISGKLDTLNAELATANAEKVPQATIDGFTADVNTAIAAVQAITALATA
jgi:hypothetical protein